MEGGDESPTTQEMIVDHSCLGWTQKPLASTDKGNDNNFLSIPDGTI
jgi:hypothetical protein